MELKNSRWKSSVFVNIFQKLNYGRIYLRFELRFGLIISAMFCLKNFKYWLLAMIGSGNWIFQLTWENTRFQICLEVVDMRKIQ